MGEANRTSEARMRAAVTDIVAAFDKHADALNRDEAISVLGSVTGADALAWGGEVEVVGKANEVAKGFVLKAWSTGIRPHLENGMQEENA